MVNKGYGVQLNDVVLIGGLALAGYMAFKILNSKVLTGFGDTAGGVGTAVSGLGEGISTIGKSTGNLYADLAENTSDLVGAGTGVIAGGFNLISNTERLGIAAENKAAAIIGSLTTGGGGVPAVSQENLKISSSQNEVANAQASAYYSGGTYNAATGVLNIDNKGYSVMPSNVPSMISQIKTYTNAATGSTITRGAGSFLSNKGFG